MDKRLASPVEEVKSRSDYIVEYKTRIDEISRILRKNMMSSSTEVLNKQLNLCMHANHRKMLKDRIDLLGELRSLNISVDLLEQSIDVIPQSSDVSDGPVTTTESHETVLDVAGSEFDTNSAGFTSNSAQGQREILELKDFLSRPVKVGDLELGLSQDYAYTNQPWNSFLSNPAVRAKLRNFAYLRGNLHVRVQVSGTPFHYGRLLFSYQPQTDNIRNILNFNTMLSVTDNFRPLFLNYLSQAPGAVVMNVNENAPVEIVCPYINAKPMMRLWNSSTSALAYNQNFDDAAVMGTIFVVTLNQIEAVSTGASPIYLQVYAWMTEVELGTSTGSVIEVKTQSEFSTGPVERVASRVANTLSEFVNVPSIGMYAKASSMVASGVAQLASLFGWSKPIVIDPPIYVKNEPFRNGAQVIGSETLKKVSLDPKQELTVDNRYCGETEDEMTIAHVCKRRSFWNTFIWTNSTGPMTDPIFTTLVSPCMVTQYVHDDGNAYNQPTAMQFAVQPFEYWRGDITYRVEIVCSAFHRGKFLIGYDPNYLHYSLIDANLDLNKQFTKIIDIQETNTVEFRVNWASHRPWLRVRSAGTPYTSSGVSTNTTHVDFANGFIYMYPYTRLVSPDNSFVYVNVYVYSDNMHVNTMTSQNLPLSYFIPSPDPPDLVDVVPQSATIVPDETRIDLNESTASVAHISEEYFGEEPISFRSLLKRYTTFKTDTITATTFAAGYGTFSFSSAIWPPLLEWGKAFDDADFKYLTLLQYLRKAYLGIRGGMRYRIFILPNYGQSYMTGVRFGLELPENFSTTGSSYDNGTAGIYEMDGTVAHVINTNGGIEAEFPYYSNNLFGFSQTFYGDSVSSDGTTPSADGVYEDTWWRRFVIDVDVIGNVTAGKMVFNAATAEDFSLMRYQGPPVYCFTA